MTVITLGDAMASPSAVTQVTANKSERENATEVLAFFASHGTNVKIVAKDGSSLKLSRALTEVLESAADLVERTGQVHLDNAESQWLSPNDAAALLGISRPTVLKMIDEGLMQAENVPGSSAHRRLLRSSVESFKVERDVFHGQMNKAAEQAIKTGLFSRAARKH
ncbi:MAG TPA: helix-turn-helix domain-containing protein [Candidatus Paceibacterota bacterium]|nr:helix-turn-helix domain-containing protein [Candidatus Paceibacterota bacterium]